MFTSNELELQFWTDVFVAGLKNPKVVEVMIESGLKTQQFLVDQLAAMADQSLKAWRQRTSEQDRKAWFEFNLLSGTPK